MCISANLTLVYAWSSYDNLKDKKFSNILVSLYEWATLILAASFVKRLYLSSNDGYEILSLVGKYWFREECLASAKVIIYIWWSMVSVVALFDIIMWLMVSHSQLLPLQCTASDYDCLSVCYRGGNQQVIAQD